jgi:hypothetical protein
MSLLRGWLQPNLANAEERFIDFDGAPYDGKPGGADPIRRALRTPVLKVTAIAALFLGAAAALCVSQSARQMTLLVFSVAVPCGIVGIIKADAKNRRSEYSALKNVVIDKTGRTLSGRDELNAADDYYRRDVESAPRFFLMTPPLLTGIWLGFSRAIGFPALQHIGIEVTTLAVVCIPFAAKTVWAAYARRQLRERRWSLSSNPPALKKKPAEPQQRGVIQGLVPVRVRAAPAPNR